MLSYLLTEEIKYDWLIDQFNLIGLKRQWKSYTST